MTVLLHARASDYFVTSSDLNIRSNPEAFSKSLGVIPSGDTLNILEHINSDWVKVEYKNRVGYSSTKYLIKVGTKDKPITTETQTESTNSHNSLYVILTIICATIFLSITGKKYRSKWFSSFLSLFFGTLGLQKFYLGKTAKGIYSLMFFWTLIPTIVGIIDFVTFVVMKEVDFNSKFNPDRERKNQFRNTIKEKEISKIIKRPIITPATDNSIIKPSVKVSEQPHVNLKNEGNDQSLQNTTTSISLSNINGMTDEPNKVNEIRDYPEVNSKPEFPDKKVVDDESFIEKTTDEEIKKFVVDKYPNDYSLQEFYYKIQVDSKFFMGKTTDEEIKKFVVDKYSDDYSLQEYYYKNQVDSKSFMEKITDEEIKKIVVDKYPNDYSLQEFYYKKQKESKSFMAKAADVEIKKFAVEEYPNDYTLQEYSYNKEIACKKYLNQISDNNFDEAIIDINSESLNLSIDKDENESILQEEVPSWSSFYVYSFDELRYASNQQKKFYYYFKENVQNGNCIDIKDNTNYAFILYFDLLNEYEKHQDINLLEKQFKLLGECCSRTKSYTLRSMQDLLRKKGDSYSKSRFEELQDLSYQFENGFSDYDPDAFKLGKKYKDKLNLSQQEVTWLNKFENQYNVFTSIEGCCVSTIKHYLLLLNELDIKLKRISTSIAIEVDFFKQAIFEIKGITETYWSVYDQSFLKKRVESDIYNTIYRRVENSVRNEYGHKRKVGESTYYEYNDEFESRIGYLLNELISELKNNIEKPDVVTQIELNAQNVNRWINEFVELKKSFNAKELNKFNNDISRLEEVNTKNPNIENIFFEASKFIAKYDKVQSLKYYAKYIYYDLKSNKFDNQQLNTTIQKSLFNTNEQFVDFQSIIEKLIQSSNLEEALKEISNIYIPKRKKITLNIAEISEVEKKHANTVELLNEILVNMEDKIDPSQNNLDDINEELVISFGVNANVNSLFKPEISFNNVQEQLVSKFVSNSFVMPQIEVEKFARNNGLFKIQLIDRINEICAEILDGEVLIEEDEDNYIIEQTYYQEILN